MKSNLNDRYSSILNLLYKASYQFCTDAGIKLIIDVLPEGGLNAQVYQDEANKETYHVELFSDCLNLYYAIEQIINRFDENDLLYFDSVKQLGLFEKDLNSTFIEELENIFASVILIHIFFHECGHIQAGHINNGKHKYAEFDSNGNGSCENQEKEMIADWLSTKYILKTVYRSVIDENKKPISSKEKLKSLRIVIVLFWLSLSIEFQIFDSQHINDSTEWKKRTHPHPSVRLYYNLMAEIAAIQDILMDFGLDPKEATIGKDIVTEDVMIYIISFIGIMDAPLYNKVLKNNTANYFLELLKNTKYDAENKYVHLSPTVSVFSDNLNQYFNSLQ